MQARLLEWCCGTCHLRRLSRLEVSRYQEDRRSRACTTIERRVETQSDECECARRRRRSRRTSWSSSESRAGTPAASIVIRHFQGSSMPPSFSVPSTTMDITPIFNQVLGTHDARPVEVYIFRVEDLDEFVKEAYRIVGHVARRRSATWTTNSSSERMSRNSTMISSRYGRAIFRLRIHHGENSMRERAILRHLQTETPNTSPTPSAPRLTPRQSNRCES